MSLNKSVAEPSLKDVLDLLKRDIMLTLNCHAIGEIDSFNPETQTCTVKISYSKSVQEKKPDGTFLNKFIPYPILLDSPIISFNSAGAGLMTPVKKGDSCLVLFNDRDIDNWFSGAKSGPVASNRLHSMSDAITIVGLRSKSNPVQNYDAVNPTLWNGETKVKVKSDKILLENSSDKLGLVLKELVDTIKAITTTNAVVGAPCAISPASQAQLDLVATKIQGLLE